jgi:hypothetical protein
MTEVLKLIGYETEWARQKREYRDKKGQKSDIVLPLSDKSKSKSIEIEKELNNICCAENTNDFIPPSIEEVYEYCSLRHNGSDAQYFFEYYSSRDWMMGKTKMGDWKAAIRVWERNGFDCSRTDKNNDY